ncbi:TB2/DP1, HVA22 family-domain-containing protein [Phycomyces nitens]|nr:TB2/DP1, HVA22 family-domain-containing protein [Phycomyces nitens]
MSSDDTPDGCYATSTLLTRWVDTVNQQSPIHLALISLPITRPCVSRLRSLEGVYAKAAFFRFLIRRGFPPVPLFLGTTAGAAWAMKRSFDHSRFLVVQLVGTLYPLWQCWQLVKQTDHQEPDTYKAWLTYWMIYGVFQVLDHWNIQLHHHFPNYTLYRLAILYWAQSSKAYGASLIHRHVIQKPEDEDEDDEEEVPALSPCTKHPTDNLSFRILDGYQPSLIQRTSISSGSHDSQASFCIQEPAYVADHCPSQETLGRAMEGQAEW